jgi:hypothetical protein
VIDEEFVKSIYFRPGDLEYGAGIQEADACFLKNILCRIVVRNGAVNLYQEKATI